MNTGSRCAPRAVAAVVDQVAAAAVVTEVGVVAAVAVVVISQGQVTIKIPSIQTVKCQKQAANSKGAAVLG